MVSHFVLYKDSSLVRSNARSMTAEMEEERGEDKFRMRRQMEEDGD